MNQVKTLSEYSNMIGHNDLSVSLNRHQYLHHWLLQLMKPSILVEHKHCGKQYLLKTTINHCISKTILVSQGLINTT